MRSKLSEFAYLANQLDTLASASMEDLYGEAELEEQRRLMLEIEATHKQKKGEAEAEEQKSSALA